MDGVTLEQAIDILTANTAEIFDVEPVPLLEASGRILAEDFFATVNNPPFDRSPLDGYALRSADTFGATAASPKIFKVVGEECAGDFFADKLKSGEALRIMTGAPMPEGSDCVIRQEDITGDGDTIRVPYALRVHENYCFAGEDVKVGQLLVKAQTQLQASHIAVIAAQGAGEIKCFRRPKITFATTGNELQNVCDGSLSPAKLYNSNLYLIATRLKELGFEPNILGNLPDDADECAKIISAHRDVTDLLITTGGVSVGKKDIMHDVVSKLGTKIFWRVKMKPGAPALAWKTENFLGLALSGNPFAALATFELLARPVLAKLSRCEKILCGRKRGILVNGFDKASFGRRLIRARVDGDKVYLPARHESGVLFSAVDCNAFVDIPAGTEKLSAGAEVDVILL